MSKLVKNMEFGALEKEFSSLQVASAVHPLSPASIVLSGVPKNMEDRVNRVLLEITPQSRIARIVIEELDGATTEFRFDNFKENENIPDKQFAFVKPAGVELIEARELEGP